MIPIKLKLKGIYSYQEQQEIDFLSLTAEGLFGIFGAVGSGKSTILEAITYALYGDARRHDIGIQKYDLMNLRSDELLVDFEFARDKNLEDKYRFVATAKRNSKNFEDIRTTERLAYKIDKGQWIPIGADSAKVCYRNQKFSLSEHFIEEGT